MSRSEAWAVGVLVAALAPASRGESFPVEGRHVTRGPWVGVVDLIERPEGLLVRHASTYADGRVERLEGAGRRRGRGVEARLSPSGGIRGALIQERPAGALSLRLETDAAGERWWLQVDEEGGRPLSRGSGSRAGATRTEDGFGGRAAEGLASFEGVPFVAVPEDGREIHESDPRQGDLGDCYLIAALIAVARNRPEALRRMIAPNGDGTWTVTLADVGRFWIDSRQPVDQRYPYVTSGGRKLPVYAQLADQEEVAGKVRYELWPMMIEKAWAQWMGGYDALASGNPIRVFDSIGGSGSATWFSAWWRGAAGVKKALDAALRAGKPITVGFPEKVGRLGQELGLSGNHSYTLLEARDGGYVLFNPWGGSHPTRPLTARELVLLRVEIQVADL